MPLPHDVLKKAVADGQIQVVNSDQARTLENVGRSSGPPHHEPIKNLLHFQGDIRRGRRQPNKSKQKYKWWI